MDWRLVPGQWNALGSDTAAGLATPKGLGELSETTG